MSKLYARRRVRNTVLMTLSVAATVVGLGWLVLVLGALLWNGFAGLSVQVFTEMTPPPGSAGGLLNPIVGSMMMTALAVAFGTPIGILAGTYMAEYGQYASSRRSCDSSMTFSSARRRSWLAYSFTR